MRIVSYNILDGGAERFDGLANVICAQRPDIVCMVEADDASVVERLARRLNMDFIHAPGNAHASALLSRWPIRETINHAPLHKSISKSFLEATVAALGEPPLILGVLHLHAHATEADEYTREKELATILDLFREHREAGRRHLLAGDFNANAPDQEIDPARCKPRTRKDWHNNGGHIPRRVVRRVLEAGYRDSLREADPTAARTLGSFSTEFPGQRVDYIFTFGIEPGDIRHAWVEQGDAARAASDHFPIGVELA